MKAVKVVVLAPSCNESAAPRGMLAAQDTHGRSRGLEGLLGVGGTRQRKKVIIGTC